MKRRSMIAGIIMIILVMIIMLFIKKNKITAEDPAGKSDVTAAEEASQVPDNGKAHDVVEMDDEKIKMSKIEVAPVAEGSIEIKKTFTGEIRLNEDHVARVIPRFSGVVRSVSVSVGKQVSAGQTLMLIESNESLTTYEVKSPIRGVVIEKNVIVGAKADIDSESFLVADLQTVWVELNIYASDLGYVKKGQAVTIIVPDSSKSIDSTISYIGPIINDQSRTAIARVVLDNRSGDWAPGMFISAKIAVDKQEAGLVIPDDAIQTVEGKSSVFVKIDKGFRIQPVKSGKTDGVHVQILEGLRAGETIAVVNSFVLKAEAGKGEAEHD